MEQLIQCRCEQLIQYQEFIAHRLNKCLQETLEIRLIAMLYQHIVDSPLCEARPSIHAVIYCNPTSFSGKV